MNTPYNKDLIIDDGLTTTIRNVFVIPFNFKMRTSSFSRNLASQRQEKDTIKEMINKKKIESSSKNDEIEPCGNAQTKIYVIANTNPDLNPTEGKNIILPNYPDEYPSSSVSANQLERRQSQVPVAQKSLAESDLEDNKISVQDTRISMGKRFFGHMLKNINDEEYYLHYFIQLINFEDTIKAQGMINFEIVHIIQSKANVTKKGKRKNNFESNRDSSQKSYLSSLVLPQIVALKNNLSGNVSDRIETRRVILDNFNMNCKDEESYNKYLAELIDLEEEFVEC
jgi:hypothetical protein